jgi:hypothetical protein
MKMKIKEFTQKIEAAIKKHNINQFDAEDFADFSFYGLRFEDKEREVGEVCGNSRHNFDREDEREFPEFGSDEYDEMTELDGTSAYYLPEDGSIPTYAYIGCYQKTDNDPLMVSGEHCYIIGGDIEGSHDDPDRGEILICDAVVVEKLF